MDLDLTEVAASSPCVRALPEQKAKMCASRSHRALLEQLAHRGKRDRILGIAEHAKLKPRVSRNLGGIERNERLELDLAR